MPDGSIRGHNVFFLKASVIRPATNHCSCRAYNHKHGVAKRLFQSAETAYQLRRPCPEMLYNDTLLFLYGLRSKSTASNWGNIYFQRSLILLFSKFLIIVKDVGFFINEKAGVEAQTGSGFKKSDGDFLALGVFDSPLPQLEGPFREYKRQLT